VTLSVWLGALIERWSTTVRLRTVRGNAARPALLDEGDTGGTRSRRASPPDAVSACECRRLVVVSRRHPPLDKVSEHSTQLRLAHHDRRISKASTWGAQVQQAIGMILVQAAVDTETATQMLVDHVHGAGCSLQEVGVDVVEGRLRFDVT
jgi:hypothetical protein